MSYNLRRNGYTCGKSTIGSGTKSTMSEDGTTAACFVAANMHADEEKITADAWKNVPLPAE